MWNNLLKISLLSYIWKRYKKTVILLPALLIYFWVIGLAHDDYLAYAKLQNQTQWLGVSFFIKWLLLLVGVGVFVALHLSGKSSSDALEREASSVDQTSDSITQEQFTSEINDSFERIRQKDSLRSKADTILKTKEPL